MTDQIPTTKVYDIPAELNEDEQVEFIRNLIRSLGGDPDTAYLVAMKEVPHAD